MDGIIIINKPKNITSRDVVNIVCKKLGTKKVGHTGTLDPIAQGVMVLCVGKATKLVEILTCDDKEYVATVRLGVLTDTLDMDGKILESRNVDITKSELKEALRSFIGEYDQEVPSYSAVKINGKKLYEYARNGEKIILPKRKVKILDIELIDFNKEEYIFKVRVSKGTYIRSLIRDINNKLGIIGSMSDLIRTKQGRFMIEDACTLEDINNGKYKILTITDVLKNNNCVIIDDIGFDIIKNGAIIDNKYNKEEVVFIHNDEVIAIYRKYDKDNTKMKPYKMFM